LNFCPRLDQLLRKEHIEILGLIKCIIDERMKKMFRFYWCAASMRATARAGAALYFKHLRHGTACFKLFVILPRVKCHLQVEQIMMDM
jgi:hypothetical protein